MAEKIRHRIAACLRNELHPDELTDDETSYLELFIYRAACRLIGEPQAIHSFPSNLSKMIVKQKDYLVKKRLHNVNSRLL